MIEQQLHTYIGIDPGLSGAVASIADNGCIQFFDAPTIEVKSGKKIRNEFVIPEMVKFLKSFLRDSYKPIAGLESVHSMPEQGISSAFRFGHGLGIWEGILSALEIPYTKITPQRWKKAMMPDMGKEKQASCLRSMQLYPHETEQLQYIGRNKKTLYRDGRGDALLIAEYVRRVNIK
jgi:hypothetical protein